jgi:uncharacterized protein (TIGR03435 family)
MKAASRLCVTVLAVCSYPELEAQQSNAAFEVVSIRRNVAGGISSSSRAGDTYRATGASILTLIPTVYQIRRDQLVGGPGWLETDRFDITAKAAAELTLDRWRSLVRTLLEERFGLVLGREQREGDLYVLSVPRLDGRLGPDLHRVADDCVQPLDPLDVPRAAPRSSTGARPSLVAVCATIDSLAGSLSRTLQAGVINQTGLSGKWDYAVAHGDVQLTPVQDDRPGLLTAVQEQLGLKLERQRGLIEVWVIKSIHPPTEN